MNYIVLGLGILLAGAGCLSVFAGYDIIEVERGWTEVIAGATALSGGVVTIALSLILRRLKLLSDLYASMQPVQVPAAYLAEGSATDPIEAAVAPTAAAVIAAPVQAPILAVQAPSMAMGRAAPSPTFASASPFQSGFIRARSNPMMTTPPLQSEPVTEQAEAPEPVHALASTQLEDTLPPVHDLDLHEAIVDEPHPQREAPGQIDLQNVDLDELERRAHSLQEPVLDPVVAPAAKPSASSLSIDEMWQRVSDEIEKPIFPAFTHKPPAREPAGTPAIERPEGLEATHVDAAPSIAVEDLHSPAHLDPAIPSAQAEAEAREKLLSDVLADLGFDDLGLQPPENAAAPSDAPALAANDAHGIARDANGKTDHGLSESPPRAAAYEKPIVAPPQKAAMIGRYEAEGTAYLMFADGSIEAQSEAGIFHFASMAELKTFIESKQAAEP
jgi:hypothetical protein